MLKNHKLLRFYVVTAVLLVAFLTLSVSNLAPSVIQAEEGTTQSCNPYAHIVHPYPGQVVEGVMPIELYTNFPSTVQHVKFFLDGAGLGEASVVDGNPSRWGLEWPTSSTNNGPHLIRALVQYADSTMDCEPDPVEIIIENASATSALLRVNITPQEEWTGPTNTTFLFEANSYLVNPDNGSTIDVTDETSFTWHTTIGVVGSGGYIGNFFSGPEPGSGQLTLDAHYGGQDQTRLVQLAIFNSEEPGSDYDDYFDEDSSDNTSDDGASEPTSETDSAGNTNENIIVPEDPNRVDSSLALCLMQRLGEEAYVDLLEEDKRMTSEQLSDSYGCFSERRFVIPSRIAPVDPANVVALSENQEVVKIEKLNPVRGADGKTAEAIEFSGYAQPDSSILIYIFSEPLVLSGQTDGDGRWTYTLEDPLEPGAHEAYVLVETDEGYVRSSAFGFEVAQAASTDNNPYGYSLAIVEDDKPPLMNYFVLGIVTLILLSSVILARFVWFRPHKEVPVAEITPSPMNDRPAMPEVELGAEAVTPSIESTTIIPSTTEANEKETPSQTVETQSNSPAESEDEIPR